MPDCLNLVQHMQPKCLEDSFLPLQTRKTSTAESRSFRTTFPISGSSTLQSDGLFSHKQTVPSNPAHSSPLIGVHLLAKEIKRKVTAQSYLRKIHIFQNSLQQHARTIVLHLVVSIRRRLLHVSFLLCYETVSWRLSPKIQHHHC